MNPNQEYYYVYEVLSLVTREKYESWYLGEPYLKIEEGLKLPDGRTIVDDRVKTPSQLVQEGKYDPRKNVFLSNVILNPLIFL